MSKPVVKRGKGRPLGSGAEVGRAAMIEAAQAVLRETPPSMVTRQLVAEKAGVDPALIRYYFGTVDNLVAEVAAATNRGLRARLRSVSETTPPNERLTQRISATFNMFMENPHHHEIMVRHQFGARSGEIKADWDNLLQASLSDLKDILSRGSKAGELRDVEARFLHLSIVSIAEFYSNSQPLLEGMFGEGANTADYRDKFLVFVRDLILNGLKPRQEPVAAAKVSPRSRKTKSPRTGAGEG